MVKGPGRRFLWISLFVLIAAQADVAWADGETPYVDATMHKLGRGIASIVGSPGEIIRMVEIVGQRDGYLAGISTGMLQGLWHTVLRGSVGVLETATFFSPLPKVGFAPLIYPEYVYAHGSWGQQDR